MGIKVYLFSFSILALISACNSSTSTDYTHVSKPEINSKILFMENCAQCHGSDGKLGLSGAKDLQQSLMKSGELKNIILKGKNAMPPFDSRITSVELDSLINYVLKFRK